MKKLVNLKGYDKQYSNVISTYLGYFNSPEQQLRSIVMELLDAFVSFETNEQQIADLESYLKQYFAKQVNTNSMVKVKE